MTNSEERREAARQMREEAAGFRRLSEECDHVWTVDLGDVPALFQDVAHFAGLDGTVRADELFDRMADLMDPTCQMKGIPESSYRACSRCGAFVMRDAATDCTEAIPVRYCPNCGARVIAGGEG